ncbi:MAG: ribosome recycling factor [Dethiobacteria bacterium]|jgi:ribosome recycling factor|nr:ribosome recycling factor [Bacillota bacterium]NMD33265.1 ribosome recycling factor [Bacillota bacterium]HOB29405.1 ribosome recycling factor [Bacillota bacterium]HPZ42000.1 ribosome recycling factor [Bacillota bacterium]HQD52903.1 ribosome recycling factor [Bacillota bacterium]
MVEEIYIDTGERMDKVVAAFQRELATLRAGRATPALLDRIEVNYYDTPTPLIQLAGITAPEPRLLVIQPWDKSSIGNIEKAILKSDLGLTPVNDGNVIRLAVPQLTEERRRELVKHVRKKAEESRISIRNIRREANENLKQLEKAGDISEDEWRRSQDEIQDLTDEKIAEIDQLLQVKEKEILEV